MAVQHEKTTTYILTWCLLRPSFQPFDSLTDCGMSHAHLFSFVCGVLPTIMFTILFCLTTLYSLRHGRDVLSLMSTYTGQGNEEGMRKTFKLLSGVEPRSNDQQTSTPDTEPRSPDKGLSPHFLLQLQWSLPNWQPHTADHPNHVP